MKKLLAILSISAVLAACNGGSSSTEGNKDSATAPAADTSKMMSTDTSKMSADTSKMMSADTSKMKADTTKK